VDGPVFKPVKEADLSRHLTNGNKTKGKKALDKEAEDKLDEEQKQQNVSDYPLHEALMLLKGIVLLRN
jgi:carboxyl-terminal processing protease